VLASIGPGEDYWINTSNAVNLPVQAGTKFSYVTGNCGKTRGIGTGF
jgi:hypothetical protein